MPRKRKQKVPRSGRQQMTAIAKLVHERQHEKLQADSNRKGR